VRKVEKTQYLFYSNLYVAKKKREKMDQEELSNALNYLESNLVTHLFGYSSSKKEILLPDLVRKNHNKKLTVVCCKKNKELTRMTNSLEERNIEYTTSFDGKNNLVYCTSYFARWNIQKMIEKGEELINIGSIFLADMDYEDPNAIGIYALYEAFLKKLGISLIFLSVSPYAKLPVKFDKSHEIKNSDLKIEYLQKYNEVMEKTQEKALYFGNTTVRNNKLIKGEIGKRYPDVKLVFDLITKTDKHHIYLRTDSIDSGKVYRCYSIQTYNKFPKHYGLANPIDIRKVVANMIYKKYLPGIDKYFPEVYQKTIEEVKNLVKNYGFDRERILILSAIPLNFEASIFLINWVSDVDSRGVASKKKLLALNYLGALVACLISIVPDYGNMEEYVGRDDLETLLNFWTFLMSRTNNSAYNLGLKDEILLRKWLSSNRYQVESVIKLCKLVRKVLLFVSEEEDLSIYLKIASGSRYIDEVNSVRRILATTFPAISTKGLDFANSLPTTKWNEIKKKNSIIPLLQIGKKVFIFIEETKLSEPILLTDRMIF